MAGTWQGGNPTKVSSWRKPGPITTVTDWFAQALPAVADNQRRGVWVLAFARTTSETYTAIFRCSTGAPVVRLSAASMMALASMP
jgi:hypothetical protein